MKIKVEKEKCSGCHLCEMICSLFHLGLINTEKSAIRIEKDDLGSNLHSPVLCRQCDKMKCLEGTKANAMRARGEFLWDTRRAKRCPFRALPVFERKAYHCDLCGGTPQCIKVCTPAAIVLSP